MITLFLQLLLPNVSQFTFTCKYLEKYERRAFQGHRRVNIAIPFRSFINIFQGAFPSKSTHNIHLTNNSNFHYSPSNIQTCYIFFILYFVSYIFLESLAIRSKETTVILANSLRHARARRANKRVSRSTMFFLDNEASYLAKANSGCCWWQFCREYATTSLICMEM